MKITSSWWSDEDLEAFDLYGAQKRMQEIAAANTKPKCRCGSESTHKCEWYKCAENLCDNRFCGAAHRIDVHHIGGRKD